MATARPTATPAEPLPEGWQMQVGGPVDGDDEHEETPFDRVLAMMAGTPTDKALLKLYRKIPGDPNGEYCDDISIHEYEARGLSYVREVYGPGSYILWLYGPHPRSGKMARLAREVFTIAPPRETSGALAVAQPQIDTLQIMRAMMEQQQAQHAALMAALSQRPDSAAQMRETLALMSSFREAMGLNVAPAAPAAPSDPVQMMNTMLATIRQMREVSDEINPPKAPDIDPESPMALVTNILDLVKTVVANPAALQSLQGGAAANPIAVPASIQGAPQLPAPAALPVEENPQPVPQALTPEQEMQKTVLQGVLQGLIDMAMQNADPVKGGELIADALPDELLPYMQLPNWFALLGQLARPLGLDVAPHAEWIGKAKAHADTLLSAGDPD